MLTGSDSAPAKANEAKQKNDIGTAKDDVAIAVQNAQTDAYEAVYVNGTQVGSTTKVTAGEASNTVGAYVISQVKAKYTTNSNVGGATVEVNESGVVRIYTTDFEEKGSISATGGVLTWNGIGTNTGVSILTEETGGTLADITSADYGKYIDLGKSIIGTSATTDDWRILYNDITNGKVYAILADYLPNNYKENSTDTNSIISNLGLNTYGSYGVYQEYNGDYSDSDLEEKRSEFLSKLNGTYNTNYWKGLLTGTTKSKVSSGISNNKINVKGAVTAEILIASYNEKHGLTGDDAKVYTDYPYLYNNPEDSDEGYDNLYIHENTSNNCYGCWLASPYADNTYDFWNARYLGYLDSNTFDQYWDYGVCPVVILPSDIPASEESGIWQID